MIKKLRLKFILVSMGGVLLVLLIIFGTLNFLMYRSSQGQTDRLLQTIINSDGEIPDIMQKRGDLPNPSFNKNNIRPPEEETIRGAKFFYVKFDFSGNVLKCDVTHVSGLSEEDATAFATNAVNSGKQRGTSDGYQFLIGQTQYGFIAALAQRDIETGMLKQLYDISLAAVTGGIAVFFILVLIFSKWAVKPLKLAFEKQRQFISNAGHELKTPITIIAANADVLKSQIGENKWLSYIQSQNDRMSHLVTDLLVLARTDESIQKTEFKKFDLSNSFINCSLEFESIAYENNKKLTVDIQPGIYCTGNEQMLKQMLYILTDNALKHSNNRGEIKVSLKPLGSKIILEVFNTGGGIDEEEKEKIFERFYRSDSSRSRETGGYGLGLSIGKSIVDIHKGKISVQSEKNKWTRFTVTLPYQ